MLTLLLALTGAAAIFAWRFPRLLILWLPVILPAYVLRAHLGPLPTTALELIFLGVAFGATVSDPRIWQRGWDRSKAWRGPLALWILATLVAVVIAPDHVGGLGLWRAYVLEPIAYLLLLAGVLDAEKDRVTVIRALIASAVLVALWAIVQFATGRWIPHPWDTDLLTRRATGPFPFPNALSLYCAPIAALCVGLLQTKRGTALRAWAAVGFTFATLATLLAKSAGGTIAILIATAIALLVNPRTRKIAIGLGIAMIAALFIPQLHDLLLRLVATKDWSGQVRLTIWKETWNMLKDHPIFGAGFGAYPDAIAAYHAATYLEIFQYPHDILLNLWSETGLLGIVAFAWICVTWIQRSLEGHKKGDLHALAFILPLVVILLHGLVDVPYFKNDLAFAFWIFAAIATIGRSNKKTSS